jgi:hypothetical protein
LSSGFIDSVLTLVPPSFGLRVESLEKVRIFFGGKIDVNLLEKNYREFVGKNLGGEKNGWGVWNNLGNLPDKVGICFF